MGLQSLRDQKEYKMIGILIHLHSLKRFVAWIDLKNYADELVENLVEGSEMAVALELVSTPPFRN